MNQDNINRILNQIFSLVVIMLFMTSGISVEASNHEIAASGTGTMTPEEAKALEQEKVDFGKKETLGADDYSNANAYPAILQNPNVDYKQLDYTKVDYSDPHFNYAKADYANPNFDYTKADYSNKNFNYDLAVYSNPNFDFDKAVYGGPQGTPHVNYAKLAEANLVSRIPTNKVSQIPTTEIESIIAQMNQETNLNRAAQVGQLNGEQLNGHLQQILDVGNLNVISFNDAARSQFAPGSRTIIKIEACKEKPNLCKMTADGRFIGPGGEIKMDKFMAAGVESVIVLSKSETAVQGSEETPGFRIVTNLGDNVDFRGIQSMGVTTNEAGELSGVTLTTVGGRPITYTITKGDGVYKVSTDAESTGKPASLTYDEARG